MRGEAQSPPTTERPIKQGSDVVDGMLGPTSPSDAQFRSYALLYGFLEDNILKWICLNHAWHGQEST